MSKIVCKLVFRRFPQWQLDNFYKLCENYSFQNLSDFKLEFDKSIHYGDDDDADATDAREETLFSFNVPRIVGDEKYLIRVKALCELTTAFENFQKDLRTQGLSDVATVSMMILSRNIYPQHFELLNAFNVKKVVFGSIVNRRFLAPSFLFDEPEIGDQVFDRYLEEHRDYKGLHGNMLACFEHDRDSFTICFPDIIRKKQSEKKSSRDQDEVQRSNDRVVDIRVSYASIRRLIVTARNERDSEGVARIKVTFTFQINNPPYMYICEMMKTPYAGKKLLFKPPARYLTWNSGIDVKNAIKYGSAIVLECCDVDARVLFDCLDRLRKTIAHAIEFRFLDRKRLSNIRNYLYDAEMFMGTPEKLDHEYKKLADEKYFPLVYAVQAIISRGGEVFEYFFRPEFNHFKTFLNLCIECFDRDLCDAPQAKITTTVVALEAMLQQIDQLNDIPDAIEFFQRLYDHSGHKMLAEVTSDLEKEGYMRVRKLMITPTRHLYINPELIMGNRSLRKKGADNMLRIVFRDDDLRNKVTSLPRALITDTVTKTLEHPMFIGMRLFSYLCSSNSQMRDHGCYFLAGTAQEVKLFRESCGKIKIESIPKMMSRLGQCFTQARQLGVEIHRNEYDDIFDYEGGADSRMKPYCFSDGVGMISVEFCKTIIGDLRIGDCLPSCYQIRFRGYKGVVLKNSLLDEIKRWAEQHERLPPNDLPWYAKSLLFRPSQKKFQAPQEKYVEIVKISSPILVSLNKPLINILDQVSEMQSSASHERMCNRIFELLEIHMESIIAALIDEPSAFLTLNEFPKYILYHRLRDFHITEEPFLRSLLRSSTLVGLNRLVDKMQIRIPNSQGRMMFGVMDETGLLQYGEVFFQYTVNAGIKYPTRQTDKIIHEGPVLITKNPSVVAGDVRMFEAVDIPCLRDLVDVIVFPQSGPRPHPDEMAGSDLDGDEYSIFFDPELFLDFNEPAFDFTPPPALKPVNVEEVKADITPFMIKFFTTYISQDSIGAIANSHLANSDLYGINSKHCHNIAIKHNQAVDFPKSGSTPDALRKNWDGGMPPEKIERFPNFMCKSSSASYKSVRLLGDLFNRVMEVQEIMRVEELVSAEDENIPLDESVMVAGDNEYEADAFYAYNEYCTMIGGLIDNYGIQNEGQLFSGRFVAIKKRVSDKDHDDMSLYNTQHMIEEQVAAIYGRFRSEFFKDFGGIEQHTELDNRNRNGGVRETFQRVCNQPKDALRQKASAYYRVAYTNKRFLSFAWLVADILTSNRQQYLLKPGNRKFSSYPLCDSLSEYMYTVTATMDAGFEKFQVDIHNITPDSNVHPDVAKVCKKYNGLEEILFFIREWASKHNITSISPMTLDILVIKFGIGDFHKAKGGNWLSYVNNDEDGNDHVSVDLDAQLGGIGKRFLDFIQFIMTRSFGYTQKLSLLPFSSESLETSQCLALYYAALDTFYPIAVNRRFDCLPGSTTHIKAMKKVTEGNLFVVEIPQSIIDYKPLFDAVARKCGCKYVVLRKKLVKISSKNYQISVKPVGSFLAIRKLRNLLEVEPRMSEPCLQKRSDNVAKEVFVRLQYYARDDIDIDNPFNYVL